jgi:hypothetical protein
MIEFTKSVKPRYFYISYFADGELNNSHDGKIYCTMTSVHPLEWMDRVNECSSKTATYKIISWQEITKSFYEKYKIKGCFAAAVGNV